MGVRPTGPPHYRIPIEVLPPAASAPQQTSSPRQDARTAAIRHRRTTGAVLGGWPQENPTRRDRDPRAARATASQPFATRRDSRTGPLAPAHGACTAAGSSASRNAATNGSRCAATCCLAAASSSAPAAIPNQLLQHAGNGLHRGCADISRHTFEGVRQPFGEGVVAALQRVPDLLDGLSLLFDELTEKLQIQPDVAPDARQAVLCVEAGHDWQTARSHRRQVLRHGAGRQAALIREARMAGS